MRGLSLPFELYREAFANRDNALRWVASESFSAFSLVRLDHSQVVTFDVQRAISTRVSTMVGGIVLGIIEMFAASLAELDVSPRRGN